MMNYIDQVAYDIHMQAHGTILYRHDDWPLYRMYALLVLVKGHETTASDVHDAWSAWQSDRDADHWSLIPFDELSTEVQEMDEPYVRAIHVIARRLLDSGYES